LCNTQVIIPQKTICFSDHVDPPDDQIAQCTLHSFPNLISHTIAWAKNIFITFFEKDADEASLFLKDKKSYLEEKKSKKYVISNLYNTLIINCPKDFNDCLQWARVKFEELFTFSIRSILKVYPKDHKTETGALFWSGNKRFPTVPMFDPENKTHLQFVISSAILYANVYSITPVLDSLEDILNVIAKTELPEFVPQKVVKGIYIYLIQKKMMMRRLK
jgi:ubiquitin-activating enzyme E1